MAAPVFTGGAVGLDLGLREFATLSTGETFAPPQYYRKAQKNRRRLARQLSGKKLGSRNREQARLRLARLDEQIANQRRDFHHKLSRKLVEENQFIGLEDLNVRGMLANHHLAKSIGDAGWSAFVTMLGYKGEWYGCKIFSIKNKNYDTIQDIWYKYLSLNVATGAICSTELKRVVRQDFQNKNVFSYQA